MTTTRPTREVVRVTLLDTERTPMQFEIPAFPHEPQIIRWRERVYLREAPGVFAEVFGFPLRFDAEPLSPGNPKSPQ
jgi:hypothetical protein